MDALKSWFYKHRRSLPWRNDPSPYEVWVSETMLQQTQVSVVIPYFDRWMKRFPTIQLLAEAPLDDVIKVWEGLGYYSRARNLHAGAKYLVEHNQGELTRDVLLSIKGIGPYTHGAILSFAFKEKKPAVDGNVIRVISRLYKIEEDVDKTSTKKEIYARVEKLLEVKEPFIVMEALIELGALVCKKVPQCDLCPLSGICQGKGKDLPLKRKKVPITRLYKDIALVMCGDHVLVGKRDKGVMQDLWEFPELCEVKHLPLEHIKDLPKVTHGFTRFVAELTPRLYRVSQRHVVKSYKWVLDISALPFSAGHRRIVD